jgi:parallel beta-helix repeat protein
MKTQIPVGKSGCEDNTFKWFSYYDLELREKVETKLSGLCSPHYHALGNKSMNIRFDEVDLRLKSLSSELHPGGNFENLFQLVFSEYSVYKIIKNYTKYTPTADLVYLNDEKKDLMIRWNDNFSNTVRENNFVSWDDLYKNRTYAKGKENRFFDEVWKTKSNSMEGLKKKFTQFLNPFLDVVDKKISKDIKTDLNVEDYLRYLALSSIFGSGHMDSHNLVFTADIQDESLKKTEWHPIIYDLSLSSATVKTSLLMNLNYISEFFFRNPKYLYSYFKELNNLNKDILGKGKLSGFYNKFDCEKFVNYSGFTKTILETTNSWVLPIDINGLCASVSMVKSFESARYNYISDHLMDSSFRWAYVKESSDKYLAIWNPSVIPSKLVDIKCGMFSCLNNWQRVNKMWWEDDGENNIISANMTRINASDNNPEGMYTKTKFRPVPQKEFYFYKWVGKKEMPLQKDISFMVVNAVTEEKIYAVNDFYPLLSAYDAGDSKSSIHKLVVNIKNPIDSKYEFEVDQNIDKKSLWKLKVESKKCKYVSEKYINGKNKKFGDYAEYTFDCSEINENGWPYVLDYKVALFYEESRVGEAYGEFFQEYIPPTEGEVLNKDMLEKYKVSLGQKEEIYGLVDSMIDNDEQKKIIKNVIEKQKNIYILPVGQTFDMVDDVDIGDSLLVVYNGVKLVSWPLVKLKVGALIVLGNDSTPVSFFNKGHLTGWGGIEITTGGYISYTDIRNVANIKNGAIGGKDLMFLGLDNVGFLGNSSNLHCDNCFVDIDNSRFEGGKNGIKLTDSVLNSKNITCLKQEYCFNIENSFGSIQKVQLEDIKARAFKIDGQESGIKISDVKAKNVPILISKTNYPEVVYSEKKDNFDNVKIVIADLDSQEMYQRVIGMSPDDFVKEYEKFLERDKNDSSKFHFKKKFPVIEKDIIIPTGITLEILAGTKIELGEKTSILSYGKIIANGNKEDKIIFTNHKDKKNKSNFWGVVAIKGKKSSGVFDNVIFENGGGDYLTGFDYSGAITADHSEKLMVKNSIFRNNSGDDAINCKFSLCQIYDNLFEKNSMDAIDFDFANPISEIRGNIFLENGNDSVDLSFSDVKVYENQMISSGDKGVSVGEESHPLIFNNLFKNNNIGIEAKDSSVATLINNDFMDNKLHLNAYQKKKRFDFGGTINAFNNVFSGKKSEKDKADDYSIINIKNEKDFSVYKKYLDFYDLNNIKYGIR